MIHRIRTGDKSRYGINVIVEKDEVAIWLYLPVWFYKYSLFIFQYDFLCIGEQIGTLLVGVYWLKKRNSTEDPLHFFLAFRKHPYKKQIVSSKFDRLVNNYTNA